MTFLDAVYPDVPAGMSILIWSLPSKRSVWCASADEAEAAAAKLKEREDVYVGVGLRRAGLDPTKRGGDEDIAGLAGLVADFDIAGPGHTKTNLPRDRAEVQRIIDRLPLPPSVTVVTGGGVHCWWLFAELWTLDSDAERQRARAISRGWAGRIKATARDHHLDVDAVHDLARVLRVPGTYNHKNGNRRPVTIESITDRRYQPSSFEEFAVEILESIKLGLGGLILRGDAAPPFVLFDALRDNEPKFRLAWERKRRDLQDQSASSYDYSLTNFAVAAGWDDQEIVDLLIAHRAKHGDNLKLREDYYARTIGKVRAELAARTATKELEAELAPPTTGATPADVETSREKAIAVLRAYTGLTVERIIRHGDVDGEYELILADGRSVRMGKLKDLRAYQVWWDRAFELTCAAPEQGPKAAEWRKALAHAQSLVEVKTSPDLAEIESLRAWIRDYTQSAIPNFGGLAAEKRADVLRLGQSYIDDGYVYFQLTAFRDWLAIKRIAQTGKELSAGLRQLGWEPLKVGVRTGPEKVVSRHVWRGAVEA